MSFKFPRANELINTSSIFPRAPIQYNDDILPV